MAACGETRRGELEAGFGVVDDRDTGWEEEAQDFV